MLCHFVPFISIDIIHSTFQHHMIFIMFYSSGRIGDIHYSLTREFWGSIDMVGEAISVTGKIHGALPSSAEANQYHQIYHDEASMQESEIGYFTMVDAVASDGIEGVRGVLHP